MEQIYYFFEGLIYPLAKSDLTDHIFIHVVQPKCFLCVCVLVEKKIFKWDNS